MINELVGLTISNLLMLRSSAVCLPYIYIHEYLRQ